MRPRGLGHRGPQSQPVVEELRFYPREGTIPAQASLSLHLLPGCCLHLSMPPAALGLAKTSLPL